MSYRELLLAERWKIKREEIVRRDGWKCRNCHNQNLINDPEVKLAYLATGYLNGAGSSFYQIAGHELPSYNLRVFQFAKSSSIKDGMHLMVYYSDVPVSSNIQLVREALPSEVYRYRTKPEMDRKEMEVGWNDLLRISTNILEVVSQVREYRPSIDILLLDTVAYKNISWKLVKGLNVHHTYYQHGLNPWEYPNDSMETYCQLCHEELHRRMKIPVLDRWGREVAKYTACYRCGGSGWLPEFRHVESGICFRCNGAKYEELMGDS